MKCKICGKEFNKNGLGFGSHLSNKHSISTECYYLKYIGSKGRCEECEKPTKFLSLLNGYQKYCSRLCSCKNQKRLDKCKTTWKNNFGVDNPSKSKRIKLKKEKTCLKHYGVKSSFQSEQVKNNIQKTMLERYNVPHPMHSKRIKEKLANTNMSRRGVRCVFQDERIKKKIINTNLDKYGVKHNSQRDIIKKKKVETSLKHYGVIHPTKSKTVRNKTKKTNIKRFGCENPSSNSTIKNKKAKTSLRHYGVEFPLQSRLVRDKIKATNIKRYGVENPSQDPEIHKKIFAGRKKDNHGYLSNSEYKFSKKLRDTFVFKSEYFLNGHHFDFAIFKQDKLDVLVEIDGEYFHGICSDCDGQKVRGDTDSARFSLIPRGVKFLVIDASSIKEGFNELRRIYRMSYKEWIKDMINSIPKSIPYYSFSDNRMRKDYSNLCTYKYHKNANLGISTIKNFHRSLFNSIDWSTRKELIKEHKIYYSPVSSHNPLDGLIKIENISKLREKYRKKYKGKKEVKIKNHTSEKMLAICSLGKRYVSKCTNKDYLEESKMIIKFHKLNAVVEG